MLTNEQIKKKIDINNELISSLIDPTQFTLNKQVDALLKENEILRSYCSHEFDEDGICKYCYTHKEI